MACDNKTVGVKVASGSGLTVFAIVSCFDGTDTYYWNQSTLAWTTVSVLNPTNGPFTTTTGDLFTFNSTSAVTAGGYPVNCEFTSVEFVTTDDDSPTGNIDNVILEKCVDCDCGCDPLLNSIETGESLEGDPSGGTDYYISGSIGGCITNILCGEYLNVVSAFSTPGSGTSTVSMKSALEGMLQILFNTNVACAGAPAKSAVGAMIDTYTNVVCNNLTDPSDASAANQNAALQGIWDCAYTSLCDSTTYTIPSGGTGSAQTAIQYLMDNICDCTSIQAQLDALQTHGDANWAGGGGGSGCDCSSIQTIIDVLRTHGDANWGGGGGGGCDCSTIQGLLNIVENNLIVHGDANWGGGGGGGSCVSTSDLIATINELKQWFCAKLVEAQIQPRQAPAPGGIGPGTLMQNICFNTCEGTPLVGARIWVTPAGDPDTIVAGSLITDEFGCVKFSLAAGTKYWFWAEHDTEVIRPNPTERTWM